MIVRVCKTSVHMYTSIVHSLLICTVRNDSIGVDTRVDWFKADSETKYLYLCESWKVARATEKQCKQLKLSTIEASL